MSAGTYAGSGAEQVVLFARQPIIDARGRLHGHELLFRRDDGSGWPVEDEDQATAHVLVGAFADLGAAAIGDVRAWVNIPRSFLLETDFAVLPPDRVVIELLERNVVDAAYVARARELVRGGYQLALDDFTWHDELVPLLEVAAYVKLDLRELGTDGVAACVRRLAPFGARVLAEKVETAEERDACLALGVELFQGYFFERPRLVRGRPAPHAALDRLRLVTSVSAGDGFEEVERVVRTDPGLSVRLLRYVNSVAVARRHPVASLRQAMMLVGAKRVRQWLLLVLLGDLGRVQPALLSSALLRARLCEQLAGAQGVRGAESAFAVGLLSVCDALLEAPLDEVIPSLPLTDEVRDAIVRRRGPLGALLTRAVLLQHGDVAPDARETRILAEALAWADAQLAGLAAA